LPVPGKVIVNLPNNHLQYALTWFGLAAVLVGVFAAFVRAQWREQRSAGGF
jgi:surfeit locus 1 family protein